MTLQITPLTEPLPSRQEPFYFSGRMDRTLAELNPAFAQMSAMAIEVNDSAAAATAQAVIATDQAAIATDQAAIATGGANTATAQAVISVEQAGIATDQAVLAGDQAAAAKAQADIVAATAELVLPARINSIGSPGGAGFGKGICPSLPAGFTALPGYTEQLHGNYGDYQYSDGSIMGWIPKFWYRVGHVDNPTYGVHGFNSVDIRGLETFTSTAAANAAGYALHRAFIDGGVEKDGVMVDKYQCSNNGGIASSIAHGNPLSTHADHNPLAALTGAPPNFYYGALAAAKTRGAGFFCSSRFIFAALALLSLAHGQAATSTTNCAWFGTTTNYPKGNNNNALRDANDTSVLYLSDGYSNCGKTGSGLPFAKTTHNGQACGIADLNGNVWEVSPGLTCVAVGKAVTGASQANPCVLTIVGHGATSGAALQITGVVGMTQLNDRIFTATVVDVDRVSLDGVDATAFTAYTSGGTATYGTFHVLKTTAAMKNITGGNTLATDHWGAPGLAANFEALAPNFNTAYPNNGLLQRYGSGANQVLAAATSGADWAETGSGLPLPAGMSPAGSNGFGQDYYYQQIVNELCPIAGGYWLDGGGAGVWSLPLNYVRGLSSDYVGLRAALYL